MCPAACYRRFFAHRRASRLSPAVAADSRGTSSKSPRFIRRRRRFGDFPTVVPAGAEPRGGGVHRMMAEREFSALRIVSYRNLLKSF